MIELVFIIVILGILASIAVPKMSASREDAKVVALKQDIDTIVQSYSAHVMSQGFDESTFRFSQVATIDKNAWVGADSAYGAITGGWFVMYSRVGLWTVNSNSANHEHHSCARFTINANRAEPAKSRLILTIARNRGDANENPMCAKLHTLYGGGTNDKIEIEYEAKGKSVVF